jgi:hypothetical protein
MTVIWKSVLDGHAWLRPTTDRAGLALSLLSDLPERHRPTHFSYGERLRRSNSLAVTNNTALREYLASQPAYCFHGDGYAMHIGYSQSHPTELGIYGTSLSKTMAFMQEALPAIGDIVYANAGVPDEFEHRNGVTICLSGVGGGTAHGWVGRDTSRYAPGLYWLNYWSDEYAAARAIDVEAVAARLPGRVTRTQTGCWLQLYDLPGQWTEWSGEVDDTLESTPGFFSKRRVPIPESAPPKEITGILVGITTKWP